MPDYDAGCCAAGDFGHEGGCYWVCPDCSGTSKCPECNDESIDDFGGCGTCDSAGGCLTCYEGVVGADV